MVAEAATVPSSELTRKSCCFCVERAGILFGRYSCSLYSAGRVAVTSLGIVHELYDVHRNRM